jgi:uncharacterized protein
MKRNLSKRVSAGEFSSWLSEVRKALVSDSEMKVECGECTACCYSSYFIHISSNEEETLRCIPKEIQFSAIGSRKGDVLLGYRKDGSCPMLSDGKCKIYECRPRTCRKYDCRILSATGYFESEERPLVNKKIVQWEFEFENELARKQYEALKIAASFLERYETFFPENWIPSNSIQKAVVAVQVFDLFIGVDGSSFENSNVETIKKYVKKIMNASSEYEAKSV